MTETKFWFEGETTAEEFEQVRQMANAYLELVGHFAEEGRAENLIASGLNLAFEKVLRKLGGPLMVMRFHQLQVEQAEVELAEGEPAPDILKH